MTIYSVGKTKVFWCYSLLYLSTLICFRSLHFCKHSGSYTTNLLCRNFELVSFNLRDVWANDHIFLVLVKPLFSAREPILKHRSWCCSERAIFSLQRWSRCFQPEHVLAIVLSYGPSSHLPRSQANNTAAPRTNMIHHHPSDNTCGLDVWTCVIASCFVKPNGRGVVWYIVLCRMGNSCTRILRIWGQMCATWRSLAWSSVLLGK